MFWVLGYVQLWLADPQEDPEQSIIDLGSSLLYLAAPLYCTYCTKEAKLAWLFDYLCKIHLGPFLLLSSTWEGIGKISPRSVKTTVLKTICFAYLFQVEGHTDTEKQQAHEMRFKVHSGYRVLPDVQS